MTNAAAKKTTTRTRKVAADGSLDLTTGELKVGPAKKATTKKSAPVARKSTAKKAAAPAPDKPKSEQTFEERDWTYLDEKEPSEQHVLFAKEINKRTNLEVECDSCEEAVEISPKQVQAVLAMFPHFQKSDTNKKRSGYRPLAEEIVHQRSIHMTQAHKDAREILDGLAQKATKKAPAKAPAKKAAPATKKAVAAKPVAAKKATTKARVTKRTPAIPAPATEAF